MILSVQTSQLERVLNFNTERIIVKKESLIKIPFFIFDEIPLNHPKAFDRIRQPVVGFHLKLL